MLANLHMGSTYYCYFTEAMRTATDLLNPDLGIVSIGMSLSSLNDLVDSSLARLLPSESDLEAARETLRTNTWKRTKRQLNTSQNGNGLVHIDNQGSAVDTSRTDLEIKRAYGLPIKEIRIGSWAPMQNWDGQFIMRVNQRKKQLEVLMFRFGKIIQYFT